MSPQVEQLEYYKVGEMWGTLLSVQNKHEEPALLDDAQESFAVCSIL